MAAEQPDATLAELAAEVPSATPDLVEHVLEEYGDPAEDGPAESPDAVDERESTDAIRDLSVDEDGDVDEDEPVDENGVGEADGMDDVDGASDQFGAGEDDLDDVNGSENGRSAPSSYPDADSLTAKERRTLEAIRASPEATQGELAAQLDVTAPTISNRVNSLPGFEWSQRETFVDEVLPGSSQPTDMDTATTTPDADAEPTDELAELAERLDALETKVDAAEETHGPRPAAIFTDPGLLHKVVHACMESEAITEDEELRILEGLLPGAEVDSTGT